MNRAASEHDRDCTGEEHVPVLLGPVLELLRPGPGMRVVDGTVGRGGHAERLVEAIGVHGALLAVDRDPEALDRARARLKDADARVLFEQASFCQIPQLLDAHELGTADRVLLDLGLSSAQLGRPERGFSFSEEGPLDMRFDPGSGGPTAAALLARLSEPELADLLHRYGQERFSRRIAKRVVRARGKKPIETTGELADIVRRAVPGRSRIDKATRTFQALRIAVNDELGELERALTVLPDRLAAGGRFAVISFHSLEDRLVKRAFRALPDEFREVTRKPVGPSAEEKRANPRSRSAKLRVIERIGKE